MSSTHFTREEYRIRTIPMSAPPTAFLAPSLYFEGGCLVHVVCMVDIYPIRAPLFGVILGTEPRQPIVYPCDLQTRTKTLLGPTQGSMNSTIDANFIVYTNCRPCVPFEKNTFTQCFPRSTGVESVRSTDTFGDLDSPTDQPESHGISFSLRQRPERTTQLNSAM